MQLKNGDGLITVQTRRRQDRMAVSVGFSDARLRAQAAANFNHLQDLLQSQYDAPVDFSLMDQSQHDAQHQTASDSSDRRPTAGPTGTDPDELEETETTARRPLAPGAHHEWIG